MNQKQMDARIDAMVESEVEKRVEAQELLISKRRVERLVAQPTRPPITAVTFPGDALPWYIRRLDAGGLAFVGMLAPRGANSHLLIYEQGQLSGLMAAMFYVALCEDEEGGRLFDSLEEAHKMVVHTAPKVVALNSLLFQEISRLNPSLFASKSSSKGASPEVGESGFLRQVERELVT